MKHSFVILVTSIALCGGCNQEQLRTGPGGVKLGDTTTQVIRKMRGIGARDVTNQTRHTLYAALSSEQKYFWWLLPDKTVVGILLSGDTKDSLEVVDMAIGEPGKGVEGIARWRSQKLKRITSLEYLRPPDPGR